MSEDATNKISRRSLLKGGALAAGAAVALPALGSSLGQAAVNLPMRYASTKKTTISLVGLFFIPSELAAARQIIDEFNAQSKSIYVQYVQSGWGAIGSKMTADFSSGDVPDLFQYYDAGLVPWAENGLLTNLKDLLPASTWANVVPGTLSVLTTANGVAGLPFETETPLVYYRPDLLTKAGITPSTLANRWTWDELLANAKKLNDPENQVWGVSADWASSEILFKNGLAWEAGANPIVAKDGSYSIDVNDPGTRAAVEFCGKLFSDGVATTSTFNTDVVANFAAGHAAMLMRGAWAGPISAPTRVGLALTGRACHLCRVPRPTWEQERPRR